MGYYDPHPTHFICKPVLLLGPPWSGVVGCAAWISNVTGLRFVDLDGVVEHKLETSIVSLASSAMEGMFRDAQLSALNEELPKQPFGLFATEDVGYWPTLRGLSSESFYSLYVLPDREEHFRQLQRVTQDRSRDQFAARPWLADVPNDYSGFCEWLDERERAANIASHVLKVNTSQPLTLSQQVLRHLIEESVCSEYS